MTNMVKLGLRVRLEARVELTRYCFSTFLKLKKKLALAATMFHYMSIYVYLLKLFSSEGYYYYVLSALAHFFR